MPNKVIFSADLHGNKEQYRELIEISQERNIDALIIGGDLLPKDKNIRTLLGQKKFITYELYHLFKNSGMDLHIFLIMGNDDFKYNLSFLKKLENRFSNLRVLNSQIACLNEDFNIAGYSYIPITPFIYKDWEKPDLENPNYIERNRMHINSGFKSNSGQLKKWTFCYKRFNTSIEGDLNSLAKKSNPRRTIYAIHAPPFNTGLDVTKNHAHVGSQGVRRFIESMCPLLTLHGHIHESVDISGSFKAKLGKTVSFGVGNQHDTSSISFLNLDLSHMKIKRERIFL